MSIRHAAIIGLLACGLTATLVARPGQAPQIPPPAPPTPAFTNQTRAPQPAQASQYSVETVATGLVRPWSLQFLPDGRKLVTERPGNLRIVDKTGRVTAPIAGLPAIRSAGAEGLHDVLLAPDFAKSRTLYFTYFAPPAGEAGGPIPVAEFQKWQAQSPAERARRPIGLERVARARLSADDRRLEDVRVILEGGDRRLALGRDGTLFVTAATPSGRVVPIDDLPQQLDVINGKVLRINTDGTIPKDNPWAQRAGARGDVFAIGLKDPEGATIHPQTGDLWTVDHGPMGGDEINVVKAGANLGYPLITYGRQYSGEQVGEGITAKNGLQQPVYFWAPSIGPSGMSFYTGDLFPAWKGNLFVGAMPGKYLARLVLNGERVTAEERLLVDLDSRIRDVRQGPDGALYVLTDDDNGRLLRLVPKK